MSPTASQVANAKIIRAKVRRSIEEFLTKNEYNAWILPVSCVLPFPHNPAQRPVPVELGLFMHRLIVSLLSLLLMLMLLPLVSLLVD